jgi:hypothetical protein
LGWFAHLSDGLAHFGFGAAEPGLAEWPIPMITGIEAGDHLPKIPAGDILRIIRLKTVYFDNPMERLFRLILMKQPFRKRSLENLFNLRI